MPRKEGSHGHRYVRYIVSAFGTNGDNSRTYYAWVKVDQQINGYMQLARRQFSIDTGIQRTQIDFQDGIINPPQGATIL